VRIGADGGTPSSSTGEATVIARTREWRTSFEVESMSALQPSCGFGIRNVIDFSAPTLVHQLELKPVVWH
jgi:hypothetical protein